MAPVPSRKSSSFPVTLSQIFTALLIFAEARRRPSGLNATVLGPHLGSRERCSLPVAPSQILTVWSLPPEATRLPSGLNATLQTESVWLLMEKGSFPVALSQIF